MHQQLNLNVTKKLHAKKLIVNDALLNRLQNVPKEFVFKTFSVSKWFY